MTPTEPGVLDLAEMRRVAEAALAFGGAPWAYAPHGDTGDYGVGIAVDETTGSLLSGLITADEYDVSEPVAVEVKCQIYAAHIATFDPPTVLALIDQLERERERSDKFMWQVRDTCTRAEAAEARLAQVEEALREARAKLKGEGA